MANKANSFLSGFTGGMGAMGQMIDRREQRDYNAQKMEWMKEDRAFQKQEQDNQMALRNFSQLNHIRNNLGDKKGEYDKQMLGELSNQYRPLLDQQFPGENRNFAGFKPTKSGFSPQLRYTNADGKEVVDFLKDENGQPLVLDNEGLMQMVGRTPGLVDRATQLEAQILGKGGKLPERKETFTQEMIDGVLVNRSNLTNKIDKGIDTHRKKGSDGGNALYTLPGGIEVLREIITDEENGIYEAIGRKDGKEVVVTRDKDGNYNTEDRSGEFSSGDAGNTAENYFNDLMYGKQNNQSQQPGQSSFGLQNALAASRPNPFKGAGMAGYKPLSNLPVVEQPKPESTEEKKPEKEEEYETGIIEEVQTSPLVRGLYHDTPQEQLRQKNKSDQRKQERISDLTAKLKKLDQELNSPSTSQGRRSMIWKEQTRLREKLKSEPDFVEQTNRLVKGHW